MIHLRGGSREGETSHLAHVKLACGIIKIQTKISYCPVKYARAAA